MTKKLIEIPLADLKFPPHIVEAISDEWISLRANKIQPDELEPIVVASLNETYYVLKGAETVYLAYKMNLVTIFAQTIPLDSLLKIQISHIRRNISTLNSIKLYDSLEYLIKKGIPKNELISLCNLDDSEYAKILDLDIDLKQFSRFAKHVDRLVDRNHLLRVPFYILSAISQIPENYQHYMVTYLIRSTNEHVSSKKFSWPSIKEIKDKTEFLLSKTDSDDEGMIIFGETLPDDILAIPQKPPILLKKTCKPLFTFMPNDISQILDIQKNAGYIPPLKKGQPGICVNLRSGQYCKVESKNGIIAYNYVGMDRLAILSSSTTVHLALDGENTIHDYKCTVSSAMTILKKSKCKHANIVLLSDVDLER